MLHIHRATRSDQLVDRLAAVLATPLADPFTADLVAVHSRGIERWIAQRLAHRLGTGTSDDGIAANIDFPFPATIVHRAIASVASETTSNRAASDRAGTDRPAGDDDPWRPDVLAFTILDLWDTGGLDDVDLAGFGHHVATDRHRRLPAFRHAAELLDSYQQHRPEMVRAWAAWDGTGAAPDGRGGTLPHHLGWQPRLLQVLRERIGDTRAELTARAAAALRAGTGPVEGLPPRISVFALTALAAGHFEILDALTDRLDVHAYLLHPSPHAWEQDRPVAARAPGPGEPRPLRSATPLARTGHALVTGWGRDSRELQLLLGDRGVDDPLDDDALTTDRPTPAAPAHLLQRMQADIAANVEHPGATPWHLATDDVSVQVHAAHGLHRQVEVARDAILAALADDDDLEPRDIVVMTPDVETFAPLVSAAFGAAATPDSGIPDLRVRLADRSLRVANPLMVCLGQVLAMADGRFEAGQVIELLRRDPVRARFDLSEDDVDLLDDLVADAQVKWGLDGDHRRQHGLRTPVNTWRAGLDRLIAGLVAPDHVVAAHVVPLDSSSIDPVTVGRLAEYLARLDHVQHTLAGDDDGRPMQEWRTALVEAADLLLTTDPGTRWQRWQLDTVLAEVAAAALDSRTPITLREVRDLLDDRLGGRPSRTNHQTGDLTVCSLVPMRTVPFRVVVVIGLDDGSWPRHRTRAGDDILGVAPVVGDRDPASEDRQLLLDALMAARDQFIITHRGAHQATNQPVPPSVAVSEFLDVVDATATTADGSPARKMIVTRHPLRAADVRTFSSPRPHFDALAAAGANALRGPTREVIPLAFDPPRVVPDAPSDLSLAQLVSILRNPTNAWMRHCLGFTDRAAGDARDDNLAVEASGLAGWGLGQALTAALIAGEPVADVEERLRDAGALPVGRLGSAAIAEHLPTAAAIAAVHRAAVDEVAPAGTVAEAPSDLSIDLELSNGVLRGVVTPTLGTRLVHTTYSRFRPASLLDAWIRMLACAASGTPVEVVDVAKSRSTSPNKVAISHRIAPPTRDHALELLDDLVRIAMWVSCHPTPLFTNTSGAYWQAIAGGKDEGGAIRSAGQFWSTGWPDKYGEGHDLNVLRLFGDAPLATLVTSLPVADAPPDAPEWWSEPAMPHDLGRWSRRVYAPLWDTAVPIDHGPVDLAEEAR